MALRCSSSTAASAVYPYPEYMCIFQAKDGTVGHLELQKTYEHMGVSINGVYPKWVLHHEKSHLEMDDLGYPYFRKPSYEHTDHPLAAKCIPRAQGMTIGTLGDEVEMSGVLKALGHPTGNDDQQMFVPKKNRNIIGSYWFHPSPYRAYGHQMACSHLFPSM